MDAHDEPKQVPQTIRDEVKKAIGDEPDPPENNKPHIGQDTSIVDMLKQEYQEVANTKDVYIPIPGYKKTGLAAKYHLPEHGKVVSQIADKVMRDERDQYTRNLLIGMDLMINLCDGLYVNPSYDKVDGYVMLDPDESGYAVDFGDPRLAEIVQAGADVGTRGVLRKLFGGNDTAIIAHAEKLNRWLADTKADLSVAGWLSGG